MRYPHELPVAKRIFDLILAVPGLVLISPFLLIIAVIIRLSFGGSILFQQTRPGYKGKLFKVNKFRSMIDLFDEDGNPLPDEDRIPPLGKFFRTLSIDELPELFNVIKGEMSLVGPRPLLVEYLDRYSSEQIRRHDVLPGMTGWAQIHGRNTINWNDKFRYDVWYVDHWSLWLDVKILARSVLKVLLREGISQEGFATAPLFIGNEEDE